MAFLPHHSEEQMRARTYGCDAHSAILSAAYSEKPDALGGEKKEEKKKEIKTTPMQLEEKHQSTLKCQDVKKKKIFFFPNILLCSESVLYWISLNRDETEMSEIRLREGRQKEESAERSSG